MCADNHRRLLRFGLLVAVLAVAAACGGKGQAPAQLVAGNCLREPVAGDPSPGPRISVPGTTYQDAIATYCNDSRAFAKIVKVAAEASGCAPNSDDLYSEYGETACSRNLAPPHAGDPGNGGGPLQVGDCLQVLISDDGSHLDLWDYHELTCGSVAEQGSATVQITKAVTSVAACGKGLLPFAKAAPGIPKGLVADDQPGDDWPTVYGPVLCVKRT